MAPVPNQAEVDDRILQVIDRYLSARDALINIGKTYKERIGGNDNLIGRIGEFHALRFLESRGQRPKKDPNSSNPGFDLDDGKIKTQVKIITHENKSGVTSHLTGDWDQLVLIELGEGYTPFRIGVLTKAQFNAAVAAKQCGPRPRASRRMFGKNGLIRVYGEVNPPSNEAK